MPPTPQHPRPFMILYPATSSLLWYCPPSVLHASYTRACSSPSCLSAFAPPDPPSGIPCLQEFLPSLQSPTQTSPPPGSLPGLLLSFSPAGPIPPTEVIDLFPVLPRPFTLPLQHSSRPAVPVCAGCVGIFLHDPHKLAFRAGVMSSWFLPHSPGFDT